MRPLRPTQMVERSHTPDLGIIKKSGSWYSYNDTKLGQGRDAAKQCIMDNPELAEELEGLIFEELKKK